MHAGSLISHDTQLTISFNCVSYLIHFIISLKEKQTNKQKIKTTKQKPGKGAKLTGLITTTWKRVRMVKKTTAKSALREVKKLEMSSFEILSQDGFYLVILLKYSYKAAISLPLRLLQKKKCIGPLLHPFCLACLF